jgi:hypothetical protein
MGSQDLPQLLVAALGDEVGVHLTQGRHVAVGVVDGGGLVAVGDLDAVVGDLLARQDRHPHAVLLMSGRVGAVLGDDDDVVGQVADGADGDAVLAHVGPQDLVRVVVARVSDVGQNPGVHGDRGELGRGCGTGVVLRCVGAHTATLPCVGD